MLASRMARSGLRPSGRKTARVVGESSPAHLARLAPTRFAVGEPTLKGRRLSAWTVSSVGRASLLHSGGRRFEPCTVHMTVSPDALRGRGADPQRASALSW